MAELVGLMAEYLMESAFWALVWFLLGCLFGWIVRGIKEAREGQ